jgi:hypothetical protein
VDRQPLMRPFREGLRPQCGTLPYRNATATAASATGNDQAPARYFALSAKRCAGIEGLVRAVDFDGTDDKGGVRKRERWTRLNGHVPRKRRNSQALA